MKEMFDIKEKRPEFAGLYLCITNDELWLVCRVNQVGWWCIPFIAQHGADMGKPFRYNEDLIEREVTHWTYLPDIHNTSSHL